MSYLSQNFQYFGGVGLHVLVIGHVFDEIEVGDVDAKVASTKMGVEDGAVGVEFFVWLETAGELT